MPTEPSQFTTTGQQASYGIGRQMGQQLADQPFDGVDPQAVAQGLIDALSGVESRVSDDDLHAAFTEIENNMRSKMQSAGKALAEEGEAFLAKNAERKEVTVLASGLQYEILTEGSGEKPSKASTVKTHYHGMLINGDVFDSSVQRNQPAEFPVGGVISGWTEALQLMGVGSKWRLYIPPQLAYGERGAGGKIGPNATLIFDVELLDIL